MSGELSHFVSWKLIHLHEMVSLPPFVFLSIETMTSPQTYTKTKPTVKQIAYFAVDGNSDFNC